MKTLTALVTALTVLGFAGSALACQGRSAAMPDQTAQGPVLPKLPPKVPVES